MYNSRSKTHSECRWPVGNESRACLLDAVRKREFEVRNEQLLNVRAADVLGLLDLHDANDLSYIIRDGASGGQNRDVRGWSGSGHGA